MTIKITEKGVEIIKDESRKEAWKRHKEQEKKKDESRKSKNHEK